MAFDRNVGTSGTGTGRGVVNTAGTVDTVSDLKSYTRPEDVVIVQGYYTAGDGGGGEFYWDATSTDTANDGTIIQATGVTTGRWKRIYSGEINVKWFGAKGDGVADDATALSAAITFVSASTDTDTLVNDFSNLTISSSVAFSSNVTLINNGGIDLDSGSSSLTAISKSNVHIRGGKITITGSTHSTSILVFDTCTDCSVSDVKITDGGTGKTGADAVFRVLDSTRVDIKDCVVLDVVNYGSRCDDNTDCSIQNIDISGSNSISLIETNRGLRNRFIGNRLKAASNVTTSCFSFNDPHSVVSQNLVWGGAYGITVGHVSPDEADYSVVTGNQIRNCATSGINIQASRFVSVSANVIYTSLTGILCGSGTSDCVLTGNVIKDCTSVGIRAGENYVVTGNSVYNAATGYRSAVDDAIVVIAGNTAMNCTVGYDWGLTTTQINAVCVGNFSGDDQVTPTMVTGFRADNPRNMFFANATDGNATFREFNYPSGAGTGVLHLPAKANQDLSYTTKEVTPYSDGSTGGTGSAGAGAQYIELNINGATYKVLHDGTV